MSWFGVTDENAPSGHSSSGSELLRPRSRPPPPQGHQTIARVQPLVPEPSMFQHQNHADVSYEPELTVQPIQSHDLRSPLGPVRSDSSVRNVSAGCDSKAQSDIRKAAPAPSPKTCFGATTEFSRMFQRTAEPSSLSVLSVLSTSPPNCEATKPSQSLPEVLPRNVVVPTNSGDCLGVPSFPGVKEQLGKMSAGGTTLADPAEMSRVIAWQNEQLVKLRQQVNQLLTFQQTSDTSGQNLHTLNTTNSLNRTDNSTQTSLPNSPLKSSLNSTSQKVLSPFPLGGSAQTCQTLTPINGHHDEIIEGLVDEVSYVQINQLHEEEQDAGRELHTTPTGGTADAAGVGGRVVGEKVLCETEEIRVVPLNSSDVTVTDEKGGVVCRDLAPPEDIDKAISDHERKSAGRTQPLLGEPSVFGRLRDMGVSFVTPSDLNCSQRRSEVSVWHPRAAEPSLLSTTDSASEYSLALNSAALKYLTDEELASLAANRGSSASGHI